jgi:thiosulfate/3-mercaptopyruvate sulfurtransferase
MTRSIVTIAVLAAGTLSALADTAVVQTSQTSPGGLLVSAAELAALKDSSLVILHIADRASAFEEAHVPGARFLRYGDFAVDGDKGLVSELPGIDEARRVFEAVGVSNGSRIVIYGSSPVMAARAFFTLDAMGHQRVALLDGGLRAWRAEGRAIETGPARAATPGHFMPALNAAKVVSADFIQQQVPSSRIALVDVRPDPEFLGTDGGMGGMHAAGHIAGARQLTWNTLVQEDGRFLSREQLQAKLDATGATKDKPVVAYCMVGMRASVVYFVARHLGYDARLYDGSIVDWTQKKLPVVTGRQ